MSKLPQESDEGVQRPEMLPVSPPSTEQADGNGTATPAGTVSCHAGCECHQKETPRSTELQKNIDRRLNRVIGQLNGVKSMIEDNRYCGDVLVQLAACESALKSTSDLILQNHLETCVVEQIQKGNTAIIEEVMHLVRRFSK